MIKPQRREDDVPDKEEAKEHGKVLNLDPYGEKLSKGKRTALIVDCRGGQGEGKSHDEQVKQLEGFKHQLAANRNHGRYLLHLSRPRAGIMQRTEPLPIELLGQTPRSWLIGKFLSADVLVFGY